MTNKKKILKKATISAVTATLLASTIATSMPFNVMAAEADQGDTPKTGLKSGMLGAGANLLKNTQFSGTSSWTPIYMQTGVYNWVQSSYAGGSGGKYTFGKTSSATFYGNGSLKLANNQAEGLYAGAVYQTLNTVAGKTYKVSYTLSATSGGFMPLVSDRLNQVTVFNGGSYSAVVGTENHSFTFKSMGPADMLILAVNNGEVTISNLTMTEYTVLNITLNPLNSTDKIATGKTNANSTVKIFNGGTLLGTGSSDASGNYSISIPAQAKGSTITATVYDPNDATNTKSASQKVTEGNIATPTIADLYTTSTTVSGTAEPGAAIVVEDEDTGEVLGRMNVATDGTYSFPVYNLPFDHTITTTTTKNGQTTSASTKVKDISTPKAPDVNPVTDKDTVITGKGKLGEEITVTIGDETYTGTVVEAEDRDPADQTGVFSITIPKQPADTVIDVTATNPNNGNVGPATQVTVEASVPDPIITPVNPGDTKVTVTGEAGNKINFTDQDGVVMTKTADANGKATFNIDAAKLGDIVTATQTNAKGKVSAEVSYTVVDTSTPAAPKVNPATDMDTTISGKGTPGNEITVTIGDETYTGEVDENGDFNITIPKQDGGTKVDVTETNSNNGNVSPATELTIADTTLEAPTFSAVNIGDTKVTITGKAGATITLKEADGTVISKVADASGKAVFTVDAAKQDDAYSATQTGANGKASAAATYTVKDTSTPTAPTVNPVKDTDTSISGTGQAGDKISIKIGDETYTGNIDENGDFYLLIPKQAGGTDIQATETNPNNNNVSPTTDLKVQDTTLAAPTIAKIKAGDTKVTVTGKPGASITLTGPDGDTTTKTADASGKATFNIDAAKAGDKYTATQTGDNGKASKAATATATTNEKPVITANDQSFNVGDTFNALTGVSASDKEDGDLTAKIKVTSNNVDTTKAGTYAVTYSVTDSDGNTTTKTVTVTVVAPVTKSIKINENVTTAFTGTTQQYTATTTPAGETVTWSTSNSNFATVNKATGLVTFKAPGTVTITASLADGTKATLKVVVTEEKVNVAAPTITSDIYSTSTSATGTAPTPGQVIAYVNGLPIGVADVGEDGKFTINFPAQAADQTIAFVAQDAKQNMSQPTNVTVKASTIKINETVTTGFIGDTQQFTATTTPADAVVTWSTSNSNLATVNKTTGLVTYKAAGTVTITATLADGTKATTKVVISAKKVAAPVITTDIYDNATSASGTVAQAGKVTAYVDGIAIGSTVVATDGTFTVNFANQIAGKVISFVAEDTQGTTSLPTTVIVKASTIKINEDITKGLVGDSDTVTATSNPAGQAVTWSSSNETIATISTSGVITYKAPGSVTITAKLANGATATKTITVADLPQPKLADVFIGDTVVNGTIDTTNYDVKQVLILVNGVNKTTVNVTDGKFSATIGAQPEGTVIEARYKDQAGNYLTAAKYVGTTTVKASEVVKITVDGVTSLQKVVTGKSIVPNASVRLYVNDVQKRTSTTDANGNYSFNSGYLKVGDVVRVELREKNVVTGIATTTVVQATEIMSLDDVTSFDRYITGKGTPNTQFKLSINGAAKTVVTSDADGLYSFTVSKLKAGDLVRVDMKSAGAYGEVFKEKTVTQGEINQGDLTLDQGEVGDKQVTGTTEQPDTQVRLSINGATKSVTKSNATGEFTFNTSALKLGDVVKVEMQVNGEYLVSQTYTVSDDSEGGGGTPTPDAKLTINDVLDSATTITGTTEANGQVRISINGTVKSTTTANAAGDYSYYIGNVTEGDIIKVELSVDGTYSVSKETTVKSDDAAKALTVNPIVAADKKVTGTATPGASLRISQNGATKSIITANATDGTFSYNLSKLAVDDVIKVEMKVNNVWLVAKEVTVQ